MHSWEIIAVCGIAFVVLEIFTPSLFFLNFAVAAFLTAVASVFVKTTFALVLIFVAFSFISFIFLRPILVQRFIKSKETGIDSKYIGQVVKAEEDITSTDGVIHIYGERWDARSENGETILKGENVRIVRNESIVMYVEKI